MKNLVKNICDKIKHPLTAVVAATCFGMLPSSCREKTPEKREPVKDMLYYAKNNIAVTGQDMYNTNIRMEVVEIRVYDDASMKEGKRGKTYQMRWGVPKVMIPQEDVKRTHAELVYLDEISDNKGWIEVYDNKYGISISKDQPCFLVDRKGRLRLIGDQVNYDENMQRYNEEVMEEVRKSRQRAEQQRREYYANRHRWDEKQLGVMIDNGLLEDTVGQEQIVPDDVVVQDSLKQEHVEIKEIRTDSTIREIPDSVRMDTVRFERR